MVSDQGVGITGVFSSKEKAEKAAREEMDAIVDACALMEPSLSKTWYGVEMEHGGRIYSNAHWDVVVTPWILDSKEFFQGGIRPFRS
jgi:hypothetical protein